MSLIDIEDGSQYSTFCVDTNDIEYFEGNYNEFFYQYLIPNRPCMVKNVCRNWKSFQKWRSKNTPYIDYLRRSYGEAEIPIANCKEKYYNAQSKTTVKFSEFANYWQNLIENDYPSTEPCLYLKDWHFTRDFPNEDVYTVPSEFSSDWLNEYFSANKELNDDYRFVYMGPKGSWTPFHADVFTSYSWSVNICGEKKWILLPPNEEEKLKDKYGHLPYDISFLEDLNNNQLDVKYLIVRQKAGEAIFIPSGWHHQVWNMQDTISINHNWVNACNIDKMLSAMFSNFNDVKNEIIEFQDTMDDWKDHCQLLLKSCFGMNFREFDEFISYITAERRRALLTKSNLKVYGDWLIGFNHLKYDLKKLEEVRNTFLNNSDVKLFFEQNKSFTY